MNRSFSRFVLVFLCGILSGFASASEVEVAEGSGRDVLVYKDGDRVQGKLIEQTAATIVFRSDRFGVQQVPTGNAVVIKSTKPAESLPALTVAATASATASVPVATAAPAAAAAGNLQAPAERAAPEKASVWDWFSTAVLTAKLANFFGPWHGRVAFSTEVVSDATDRNNLALETQLQRKWKRDEVQLKARYDYSKTNEIKTTDLVKADGLWRHDFTKARFALYRPTLEWNRANVVQGLPNDYVLLQQEIGVGLSVFSTATRKIRFGVSENLFDLWSITPAEDHTSRTVESAFAETELKLPWRMSLTERAVYYYSIASGTDGWENKIELTKKFSETLSTSVRHEIRRNNPDGRAPDYTRLKLLFGLDF